MKVKRMYSQVSQARVCIVGAGAGGMNVAARLSGSISSNQICVIDPDRRYYYKPAWALYAANILGKNKTFKDIRDALPQGVVFKNHNVKRIIPESNTIILDNGSSIKYEQLIIATGIQNDWEAVKGLKEAINDP